MKNYIHGIQRIIFGVLFVFATVVWGQEQSVIDEILSRMQQQLALTPEQVIAIKPIIAQKVAEQRASIIQETHKGSVLVRSQAENQILSPDVASTPQGELDKNEQEEMSHILTQEQMGKWNSIQSQLLKEQRQEIERAMRTGEKPAL